MDKWAGRVALVTGAGSGIGASVAERLTRHGMTVVGCDRDIHNIQAMSASLIDQSGSLVAMSCDVRKEDQVLAMFEKIRGLYGGVDVCVNCAGLAKEASLISGDTETWREMLEVNVLGLCICTREAIQSMLSRGVKDGHIIHMCSIRGHDIPPGHQSPMYCASKFAVRALTEGLRNELTHNAPSIRISHLTAADICDSVLYCLSAPAHIQVHDVIIHPLHKPLHNHGGYSA